MKISHQQMTVAVVTGLLLFTSASLSCAAPQRKAYALPDVAVEDFIAAIRDYDLGTLLAIFGSESERLFVSEDPVADANLRKEFLRRYDEKHAIIPDGDLTRILVVGKDRWPLPIPLVKSSVGWTFDTAAGIDEIINRRIGRDELSAIQTCLAVGDAQREYYQRDRDGDEVLEYAQTLRSSPSRQDGLYWPVAEGEPQSPIGELVATASHQGYGPGDSAYHGYRFRLLISQGPAAPGGAYEYIVRGNQIGGFALIAYPAAYGDSGIMTFMVSHAGIVYQKDLGEHTEIEAENMTSFNPEGWTTVEATDMRLIPEP